MLNEFSREWVARIFSAVEDVVYVGLGLLLAVGSLILLGSGALSFGQNLLAGSLAANIVALLDSIMLILLVLVLFFKVKVSF